MNNDPIKVLHELEQDGDAGLTEREREAIRQVIATLSTQQPPADLVEGPPFVDVKCPECDAEYVAPGQQPAAVDGAMVKAAQEQISEGIGAYLRKFTDSEAAKHAREHLHQMPASEWSGMTRMLAEEAVGAALAAQQGGEK